MAHDIYSRLREMKIDLPGVAKPAAAYVPFVRLGDTFFLSGHIPRRNDGAVWTGQLGRDVDVQEAQRAARRVAIDLIGTLHGATGDLNLVKIAKAVVFVNSTSTFTDHHLVANGASTLMGEVFGDAGAHARSAVGVAQLPFDACVEIELVAGVRAPQ
jgi:enamine deaminase RidA (YjgF/YER057c/UK114 family)